MTGDGEGGGGKQWGTDGCRQSMEVERRFSNGLVTVSLSCIKTVEMVR